MVDCRNTSALLAGDLAARMVLVDGADVVSALAGSLHLDVVGPGACSADYDVEGR